MQAAKPRVKGPKAPSERRAERDARWGLRREKEKGDACQKSSIKNVLRIFHAHANFFLHGEGKRNLSRCVVSTWAGQK